MKKTKRGLSTDYYFEALYKKVKSFVSIEKYSKLQIVKLLTIATWFKDIN
ncbi:hypothetical protein [Winogradskyella algicola]|nr:hypothetical protein [Winogradskyella algicola]